MSRRHYRLTGLIVAFVIGSAACVAAPAASKQTLPARSPTASGTPAPSAPRTMPAVPPPNFTNLPTLSPDEFWASLFSGDPDFTEYHSLGALIRDSDAVVVATLVSVTPGTNFDAGNGWTEYDAWVTIRVDRVLHGSLPTTPVIINVVLGDSNVVLGNSLDGGNPYKPVVDQLKVSMPNEQGILFIQNLASWEKRMTGKSTADPALYAVVSAQGSIRNANGKAKKAVNAPGAWPLSLTGKDFGAVVSQIASTKPELPAPSGM